MAKPIHRAKRQSKNSKTPRTLPSSYIQGVHIYDFYLKEEKKHWYGFNQTSKQESKLEQSADTTVVATGTIYSPYGYEFIQLHKLQFKLKL